MPSPTSRGTPPLSSARSSTAGSSRRTCTMRITPRIEARSGGVPNPDDPRALRTMTEIANTVGRASDLDRLLDEAAADEIPSGSLCVKIARAYERQDDL